MLFDLVFIIDSTASMGNLINTAKRQMNEMVNRVKDSDVNAKYSLISFRDHPPNEDSWASKIFADRVKDLEIISSIKKLNLGNGGDGAESGLDGIAELDNLSWNNEQSIRLGFFIGDAPIKGTEGAQIHSRGNVNINKNKQCPCGLTLHDAERTLEGIGIDLHGLIVNSSTPVKNSFVQFCKTVSPSNNNLALGQVLEFVQRTKKMYDWSTDSLLPELEKDPRIKLSDLSRNLKVNGESVNYGIEILNRFGYTEHLIGGTI